MKKDAFEIFVLPGILFLMILMSYGKIIGLRSDMVKLEARISNLTDVVINKLKP